MDAAAEECGYPGKYACLFAKQEISVGGTMQPIQKLIDDLKIEVDAYAAYDKIYDFDTVMKLYFAGVTEVPFTRWDLSKYGEYGQLLYAGAQQHVQDWEYAMFGKRRVQLSEVVPVANWASPTLVYWHPKVGLEYNQDSLAPITFDAKPTYMTYTPSVIKLLCRSDYACYEQE